MVEALLALLLAAAQPGPPQSAPAAQTEAASLAWLAGRWRGAGATMASPDDATLDIRPVLGGAFLEFSYRAGRFEGRAFYRRADGNRWRATWLDNRGISFGIEAVAEGGILTSDWGTAETERGRTSYRLAEDGSLQLTDSVRRPDGSYREFARHVLQRSD